MSLSALATVEVQLVMRFCSLRSLLLFARCSRTLLSAASHPFAWSALRPLPLRCHLLHTPDMLAARLHSPHSLLRHAPLELRWVLDTEYSERQTILRSQLLSVACLSSHLRSLRLIGNAHTDRVDQTVTRMLCEALTAASGAAAGGSVTSALRSLARLDLSDNLLGWRNSVPKDLFAFVPCAPALTELDLSRNELSDDALRALGAAVRQSASLRILNLTENLLTDAGVTAMAQELWGTSAASSSSSSSSASAASSSHSSASWSPSSLTQLDLRCTQSLWGFAPGTLGCKGVCALVECIIVSSSLCSLDLSGHVLSSSPDAGAALSRLVARSATLHTLRLAGCGFSDDSLADLPGALASSSSCMRVLDLGLQRQEDEVFVAALLRASMRLHSLRIAIRRLGQQTAQAAGDLLRHSRSITALALQDYDDPEEHTLVAVLAAAREASADQQRSTLRRINLHTDFGSLASSVAERVRVMRREQPWLQILI